MITAFLGLRATQAANVDQKIADAQAALRSANSNIVIQTLQTLNQQTQINLSLNLEEVIADLDTTVQTLQDEALQTLFQQHCQDLAKHGITDNQNWLKTGFHYTEHRIAEHQDSLCPFCAQSLPDTLQILNAYTNLFNEEFNALANRLTGYLDALTQFNLEVEINRINNTASVNTGRITSWNTHLPATTLIPDAHIIADKELLREQLTALIAIVRAKAQNPSMAVTATALTEFKASLTAISQNISQYNVHVISYNAAINTFLTRIQTVLQAQNNLNELQRIKKRFEPAIITICDQLQNERQRLRTLEGNYTTLSQQQQVAAQTFFITYKDRINYYLGTVFRTPFSIDNVVHVAPQGRGTQNKINYRLSLEGHEISFDATQTNSAKDCLSEGDKSTIALAFFLSKLDIDPGKGNKILVFDDPLSSFDSNRRLYTVQQTY